VIGTVLRFDSPVPVRDYLRGPNEREVAVLEGARARDDAVARPSRAADRIDVARDPQPDSFSCEAELGYRFVLDRLPAV
jgi:hypothetical protein